MTKMELYNKLQKTESCLKTLDSQILELRRKKADIMNDFLGLLPFHVFALTSDFKFSSLSLSDMDKTTELSYNHLISQLRKQNADLRNEVRELSKLLIRKDGKPPN